MSRCASCGFQLSGDAELCPHHHCAYEDDWASANRIMCDFFHRGRTMPRLSTKEHDDDKKHDDDFDDFCARTGTGEHTD